MKKRAGHSRHIIVAAAAVWAALLGLAGQQGAAQSPPAASLPERIDFNWHIRPILSENCFQCHGPDAKARKVNLRLDDPESAFAERGTPASPKRPIVQGRPDGSEMIHRIRA